MFAFPFEANFNLVHVAASKNISTNLHVLLANVPKFEPAFHGMLACSILSLTACYANIVVRLAGRLTDGPAPTPRIIIARRFLALSLVYAPQPLVCAQL